MHASSQFHPSVAPHTTQKPYSKSWRIGPSTHSPFHRLESFFTQPPSITLYLQPILETGHCPRASLRAFETPRYIAAPKYYRQPDPMDCRKPRSGPASATKYLLRGRATLSELPAALHPRSKRKLAPYNVPRKLGCAQITHARSSSKSGGFVCWGKVWS